MAVEAAAVAAAAAAAEAAEAAAAAAAVAAPVPVRPRRPAVQSNASWAVEASAWAWLVCRDSLLQKSRRADSAHSGVRASDHVLSDRSPASIGNQRTTKTNQMAIQSQSKTNQMAIKD